MALDLSKYSSEDIARARRWPKVELHLHLDGSLSPKFIGKHATRRNIALPCVPAELRSFLMDKKLEQLKSDNKAEKGGNWPVFDFCNQFLQTAVELEEAVINLLSRLSEDGVVYAEIRFCPSLHTLEGLTEEQVVTASIAGLRNSQSGVMAGIILCALRSKPAAHGVCMAQLAHQFLQRNITDPPGVVGMDVAGDEGSYPLASDKDAMAAGVLEAHRLCVPLSLHAGEWPERFGSLDNLKWAVLSGAVRRIGHAISVRSADRALLNELVLRRITIEVCLTSNVANGFKVASYDEHPVTILQREHILFSLSSDNLLLSGDKLRAPSATSELLRLVYDVGLGWDTARASILNGLRAAFSPCADLVFITEIEKKLTM